VAVSATIDSMISITFNEASQALDDARSALSISEAHGCLCGALCTNHEYSIAVWADEVLADNPDPLADDTKHAVHTALQAIHAETLRAMRGNEMEFAPLLPDDDAPLAERTIAMAQWCQGFLYGFGITSSGPATANLSTDVSEILHDFAQLARATVGEVDPTEEDESDYAEIVEYLRAGAQLIHDELQTPKPRPH
jgi:uncharacterized protein YgfB (UPF0149 family)